jgi:hypothetical protein
MPTTRTTRQVSLKGALSDGIVVGVSLLALAFILFMKLISYTLVNRDFRNEYWKGKVLSEGKDCGCLLLTFRNCGELQRGDCNIP